MNYAPFKTKNKNKNNFEKFNKEKLNIKEKFINDPKKELSCETPGYWQYEKKWDVIDAESNLISPGVGTRMKTQIEMTKPLHPNEYTLPVSNTFDKEANETFYFSGYDTGPGRGFGNLNVSSDIRIGVFSRKESKNYKAVKESEVIERWEFIDDRFSTPDHLIMAIPRGGDSTRKPQNDLTNLSRLEENKEFNFEY
jgi:hypothetical protein